MSDLETLRADLAAANINYDNLLVDHVLVEREYHKLRAENERLRAALDEIAEQEGNHAVDRCTCTPQEMLREARAIARAALSGADAEKETDND